MPKLMPLTDEPAPKDCARRHPKGAVAGEARRASLCAVLYNLCFVAFF